MMGMRFRMATVRIFTLSEEGVGEGRAKQLHNILHKEEHVGLLIKHEPESLRIGHAGKKDALK
jgi:hypothetical protein